MPTIIITAKLSATGDANLAKAIAQQTQPEDSHRSVTHITR